MSYRTICQYMCVMCNNQVGVHPSPQMFVESLNWEPSGSFSFRVFVRESRSRSFPHPRLVSDALM